MADVVQNEKFIQLKKDNILKIGIKDSEGNPTGEHLEFDLEDIELPLRINECDLMHKANENFVKMKYNIIDNQEDKKGKKLLSWKQEEKLKVLKEFYQKEMVALDLFLGEGGTNKLLNGRKPYFTMYDDIGEILEPIIPLLKQNNDDITNKIKEKYKNKEEKNVLE